MSENKDFIVDFDRFNPSIRLRISVPDDVDEDEYVHAVIDKILQENINDNLADCRIM